MRHPAQTTEKDLVLIGGGHAHVSVIKQFAMRPIPGVRLTVISRDLLAPYSGMLPGYIAGHYTLEQCHIDLAPLVKFAHGRFIHDDVVGLDTDRQLILCRNRSPINYDVVSLNIGSSPDLSSAKRTATGALDNGVIPVKPISNFVARWQMLKQRVLNSTGTLNIAVVGAGAGGVELTLAIQHRLQHELERLQKFDLQVHFHLFDSNSEILATHSEKVRKKFTEILMARQITLHLPQRINAVNAGEIFTSSGNKFLCDEILWVTRASAQSWLKKTALVLTPEGFISVDPTLQSVSNPNVFAAGDIAHVIAYPRPKAGVFAVRQGPPLARNLRRALKQKPLQRFKPQKEFLSLISTGDKYAVASRSQWMASGKLMWRWKDWIDRRFMEKFKAPSFTSENIKSNAPHPNEEDVALFSGPLMYCGGCGSKLSQSVLKKTISNLDIPQRDDIVQGLLAPDDAAIVKMEAGELQVFTVDHFCTFVDDPFLFGKICAEHALSDLYAMGAEARTAMAITTLARQSEKLQQQELQQILNGAMAALQPSGAILIGGHTNLGDMMALGFSLQGRISPDKILHKTGLRVGDKLILTKALGTGTILAAHMRNKASGVWLDNALVSMQQSNRTSATIIQTYSAHACTDVTGFGLIGHLQEMLNQDALTVKVFIGQLPAIAGAMETLKMGIVSTAQPQNQATSCLLANKAEFSEHDYYPLLFDPQTSGGLLAAVPVNNADNCLQALRQAGYNDATVIGEVMTADSAKPAIVLQ